MSTGHRMLVELRSVRRRALPNISTPVDDVDDVLSRQVSSSMIRASASYQCSFVTFDIICDIYSFIVICGGEYTSDSGMIQSPGYPENYFGDANCVWYLTVSDGFQVALQFDLFSVAGHKCFIDNSIQFSR